MSRLPTLVVTFALAAVLDDGMRPLHGGGAPFQGTAPNVAVDLGSTTKDWLARSLPHYAQARKKFVFKWMARTWRGRCTALNAPATERGPDE